MSQAFVVTLDNNCIIALEKNEEPNATAIRHLIMLHQAGVIALKIGISTAFERAPNGQPPQDFAEQISRLEQLGLGDAELFKGPQSLWFRNAEGYMSMEGELAYLHRIHTILFPTIEFQFRDYLRRQCQEQGLDFDVFNLVSLYRWGPSRVTLHPQEIARVEQALAHDPQIQEKHNKMRQDWNNAKNDALGLCAHVSWGGAIFVTDDGNFFKQSRQTALARLVPGKILRPVAALQEVRRLTSTEAR